MWSHDHMIKWLYDHIIPWSCDHMIIMTIWSYDRTITAWSYYHMIIWPYNRISIWSYDNMMIWSYDHRSCDHMITWSCAHHMIIWSYDHMIIWSCDHTIIWAYDPTIIWSYDQMIIRPRWRKTATRISVTWASTDWSIALWLAMWLMHWKARYWISICHDALLLLSTKFNIKFRGRKCWNMRWASRVKPSGTSSIDLITIWNGRFEKLGSSSPTLCPSPSSTFSSVRGTRADGYTNSQSNWKISLRSSHLTSLRSWNCLRLARPVAAI